MPKQYPTGIRPYKDGWRARGRVGAIPFSKTFPKHTPFSVMRAWLNDERALALDRIQPQQRKRSGFAKDAADYLAAVRTMPSFRDRERDIEKWVDVFGGRDRRSISAADIRAQLSAWSSSKTFRGATLSASALKHRHTALQHLYTVLDGKQARNPVKEVPKPTQPDPEPRALAYAIVEAILAEIPQCKTKARLEVLAHTGIPPATLALVKVEHIDLEGRRVFLPGRKKGKGTRALWRRITARGAHAFESYIREDAFGSFSSGSLHQVFVRARDKAAKKLGVSLAHVRPYDFRHAFGTHVLATTGDIRATQELLGHTSLKTTERYTQAAVSLRVEQAIAALNSGDRRVPDPVSPTPDVVEARQT